MQRNAGAQYKSSCPRGKGGLLEPTFTFEIANGPFMRLEWGC